MLQSIKVLVRLEKTEKNMLEIKGKIAGTLVFYERVKWFVKSLDEIKGSLWLNTFAKRNWIAVHLQLSQTKIYFCVNSPIKLPSLALLGLCSKTYS